MQVKYAERVGSRRVSVLQAMNELEKDFLFIEIGRAYRHDLVLSSADQRDI